MINNRTRRKFCWKTGKIRYSRDQAERAAAEPLPLSLVWRLALWTRETRRVR